MSGVFISYRRDDSAGFAGRLFDTLRAAFPGDTVFIDIDGIDAGRDFVEALNARLAACEVLLAVIGRQWLAAAPDGGRRIDAAEDYVRLEIETALDRNIRVIPILVDGARMPAKAALPESLEPLVRRNAMDVSHTRFAADAQRLVEILRPLLAARGTRTAGASPAGIHRLLVGGALAVVLPIVLLLAVWAVRSRPPPANPEKVTEEKRAETPAVPTAPAPHATEGEDRASPQAAPGKPTEIPIEPTHTESPAPRADLAPPMASVPQAGPVPQTVPTPSARRDPLRVVRRFDPDSGKARIEVELGPNKVVKRHAWCERLTVYTEFGNFSLVDWHQESSGDACRVRTDWKNHRTAAILPNDASPWPLALNESLKALCPKTFVQKLHDCEAY